MRIWGRDQYGNWLPVTTDINGGNGNVYLTNLIQVLLLNRNEDPFFANYGIPDQPSAISGVAPDYYVAITQKQFAPFFAALVISRVPGTINPSYKIAVTLKTGEELETVVVK